MPDIDWTKCLSANDQIQKFLNILLDNCPFEQTIKFSTRGVNLLDVLLTNRSECVFNIKFHAPVRNSDHMSFTFQIDINVVRSFKKYIS